MGSRNMDLIYQLGRRNIKMVDLGKTDWGSTGSDLSGKRLAPK